MPGLLLGNLCIFVTIFGVCVCVYIYIHIREMPGVLNSGDLLQVIINKEGCLIVVAGFSSFTSSPGVASKPLHWLWVSMALHLWPDF